MKEVNDIRTYYDNYGSWYDSERTNKYYSLINSLEIDLLRRYGKDRKVLEVGCGTGIILREVSRFAGKVMGIDLSEGMLRHARKKGLKVKRADAGDLPFEDTSFDLVYSLKVLPHVPDVKKVVLEMERVVRSDGILILEFYNPYSMKFVVNHLSSLTKKNIYVRYDSLSYIKSYLPPGWHITETRGVRIFTPFSFVYRITFVSDLFCFLERKFCSSFLKYIGGYFLVVLKRRDK